MWRGNTRSTVTLEHIPANSTHLVMKLIGQTSRFRWLLTRITSGNWALTHGVVDPIKWMLVKELTLASAKQYGHDKRSFGQQGHGSTSTSRSNRASRT